MFSTGKKKVTSLETLRERKILAVIGTAVTMVIVASVYLRGSNLASILLHPEKLAEVIGYYGPSGIVLSQFVQVLIAPIPPVTPVAGGLLYGPWIGMVFALIGATVASTLAIYLSRRYGRPFVEKFVRESVIEKFDSFTEKTGYTPFIVLFVFPGFPDDALCFIAGLSKLEWKDLAIIASLGRIPGILMLTTVGQSIAETDIILFIASSLTVATVSLVSVRYRKKIQSSLKNTWRKIL